MRKVGKLVHTNEKICTIKISTAICVGFCTRAVCPNKKNVQAQTTSLIQSLFRLNDGPYSHQRHHVHKICFVWQLFWHDPAGLLLCTYNINHRVKDSTTAREKGGVHNTNNMIPPTSAKMAVPYNFSPYRYISDAQLGGAGNRAHTYCARTRGRERERQHQRRLYVIFKLSPAARPAVRSPPTFHSTKSQSLSFVDRSEPDPLVLFFFPPVRSFIRPCAPSRSKRSRVRSPLLNPMRAPMRNCPRRRPPLLARPPLSFPDAQAVTPLLLSFRHRVGSGDEPGG